jgi:ethanolamine utilization protein EutN
MQIGIVVGHATATIKHPTLNGHRLLIVQMLGVDDKPDADPVIAIDQLGAGTGARVVVTTDAVIIREMTGARNSPIRYSVQGLVD